MSDTIKPGDYVEGDGARGAVVQMVHREMLAEPDVRCVRIINEWGHYHDIPVGKITKHEPNTERQDDDRKARGNV